MAYTPLSIRPFIGAKDFETSRSFYRDLGFEEMVITPGFSVFTMKDFRFYLQDAYVKDWVNNTMVLLEVDNVDACWEHLQSLGLPEKYKGVKLVPVRTEHWGKECFVHDPCNILWHFAEFNHK